MQFADPDAEQFVQVGKLGGHIVPVIDRTILRQEVAGKKIYFAQETQVEDAQWTKSGKKVVTACTPLVVFTGAPDRVAGEQARKDHEDLIRTVAALKSGSLLPEESLFQKLVKRTKELSATSTEKVLEATEQAREKAKPYTEKAMETAKEASEQAKQARRAGHRGGQALLRQEQGGRAEGLRRRPENGQGADGQSQSRTRRRTIELQRRLQARSVGTVPDPSVRLRPALATAPVERLAVCAMSTPLVLPIVSPSSPGPRAASAAPSPSPTPGKART